MPTQISRQQPPGRQITVVLFITVRARGTDDHAAARLVERITLDALDNDGWAPVSAGYGVRPHAEG